MSTQSSKINEMGESNLTNLSRRDATQMGNRDTNPDIGNGASNWDRTSSNNANDRFYQGNSDPQTIEKVKQNFEDQQDPFKKKPEEKK